ncbi:MAG: caspase family protein [Phycisphaerae bacterium]
MRHRDSLTREKLILFFRWTGLGIIGLGLPFSTSGCTRLILKTMKPTEFAHASIEPLPVPAGDSLPVTPRPQPYNLTLALEEPVGTFHERYGIAGTEKYGVDIGNAYRQSAGMQLTNEMTSYLKKTNTFKKVFQNSNLFERYTPHAEKNEEADLVLMMKFTKFELRRETHTKIIVRDIHEAEEQTTIKGEGEIEGNIILKTNNGTEIFNLPVKFSTGPAMQKLKEDVYNRKISTSPGGSHRALLPYHSIVEKMFEQIEAKIQENNTTLAKLSGPYIPNKPSIQPEMVGPIGRRFAVVIGVSRYKYLSQGLQNLQFADRDAKSLAQFLISPAGGEFKPENIKLLVNDEATYKNVRSALFEFLGTAIDNDFVLIYFSGHGTPSPQKPDQLYLMCHDSDPKHIASTAFPMHDLRTAIQYNIEAKRVLVLADACHSAGIASEGRRAVGLAQNTINRYLSQLSQSKPGAAIFTSSEGYEFSTESRNWGEGHGIFTWAFLQGLEGKADGYGGEKDGIVTLGEAIEYTRDFVRRETRNAQHPAVTGIFDRNLPMGIVKPSTPAVSK